MNQFLLPVQLVLLIKNAGLSCLLTIFPSDCLTVNTVSSLYFSDLKGKYQHYNITAIHNHQVMTFYTHTVYKMQNMYYAVLFHREEIATNTI